MPTNENDLLDVSVNEYGYMGRVVGGRIFNILMGVSVIRSWYRFTAKPKIYSSFCFR